MDRLPEPIQTVIFAEREFAAADIFRFVKGLNKDFVIRVDAEARIIDQEFQGSFGALPIGRGGKRLWFKRVLCFMHLSIVRD